MTKSKILFVAPSSYPIFGAEANVNAKMLKLLSEAGCVIDLVARTPRMVYELYPLSENDFFFSKLNSINMVQVNTDMDVKTVIRHLRTYLKTGYVYKGADWSVAAIKVCEKLINETKYDFIYTYDYPSELVGLYLAKKYGIKWVSVFNDPYIWERYPAPYGRGPKTKMSANREKLIADIGNHLFRAVFPSDRLRDYMLGYMTNLRKEISVVSPHLRNDELFVINDKKLNETLSIIHSGILSPVRNPETFLRGLRLFLNKCPDARIKFDFLGRVEWDNFDNTMKELNLFNYIELIPPVVYDKSLEIVQGYDICMLLEASCEEGIFLPSKVIDYMQNGKPIFAISPAVGVINDMYKNREVDYFADVTSSEQIATVIENFYSDFEKGEIGVKSKNTEKYSNKTILDIHLNQILN